MGLPLQLCKRAIPLLQRSQPAAWNIIRVMRRDVRTHALWLVTTAALITLTAVGTPRAQAPAPAPLTGVDLVRSTYTKYEYMIPMRDGARLFTAVYAPRTTRNALRSLITRTPKRSHSEVLRRPRQTPISYSPTIGVC